MIIRNFPELRQFSNYDCGPLSIEAILIYFNYNYTEAEISKIAGSNEEIGTTPEGMEKAARHFNLAYESGEMTVKKLKNNIRKNIPTIILLQAWEDPCIKDIKQHWDTGHWIVAIGYDEKNIYFEDPWFASRVYLPFDELEERWHHKMKGKKYLNYGISLWRKDRKNSMKYRPIKIGPFYRNTNLRDFQKPSSIYKK